VGAAANEDDGIAFQLINQQEVAANVTFSVIIPVAFERMIQPFGSQW
jgi:hypothetical protein